MTVYVLKTRFNHKCFIPMTEQGVIMSILQKSKPLIALILLSSVAVTSVANAGHYRNKPTHATSNKSNMTIVETASKTKALSTLVAAVSAAGLVDTLSSPGPFTVFAPTNAAFDALPAGTVDTLLKPENKPTLTKILTYHVVAGKIKARDLTKAIKANGGKFSFETVSGGKLTATLHGSSIMITDDTGAAAMVTTADLNQSNGVVHVIDKVLLPN
jgi:uncharacterized surface protein with fasciclin (FAS1) repeats